MADPLTLAAGLGAAGLGYSMYRYGMAPTLRGAAYGAGTIAGLGLGVEAVGYADHLLRRAEDAQERQRYSNIRDLLRIKNLSFPNPNRENFLYPDDQDPLERFEAADSLREKLSPLATHYLYKPGGPRQRDARSSWEGNIAAIDLQSAAEHVFGQDQDGDEYPDPFLGRPSYNL